MFGFVSEWFYKGILGICPAEDAVGFDRIVIDPHPVGDLTWAEGHCDSVRGRIESRWTVTRNRFTLAVTVPVLATATVHLPARGASDVREGGRPAHDASGVTLVEATGDGVVYRVASVTVCRR